jgi:hypothetical protein
MFHHFRRVDMHSTSVVITTFIDFMHYNMDLIRHYSTLHMPDSTCYLLTFGRLSSTYSLSLQTNVLLGNSTNGLSVLSSNGLTSYWLLSVTSILVSYTGTSSSSCDGCTSDGCGWSLVVVTYTGTSSGNTGTSFGLSVEGSELALSFSLVCVVLHIISH